MRHIREKASRWAKKLFPETGRELVEVVTPDPWEESTRTHSSEKCPASLANKTLCEICETLDWESLFCGNDSGETTPKNHHRICANTLGNISKQKECPFCVLLSKIISSNHYKIRDSVGDYLKPGCLYLEPQRIDSALCGVEIPGEHSAICLHIELDAKSFSWKVVRLAPPKKISTRPQYAVVTPLQPQVDFVAVKKWLDVCSSGHTDGCKSPRVVVRNRDPWFQLATRLIDVKTRAVVRKNMAEVKYAALSYVWGKATYEAMGHTDINNLPDPLPRTFADALTTCTALDIPYLWIDMFCINQASENDKAVQVPHMDAVYDGAFLTIVAVNGANPSSGLSRVGEDSLESSSKFGCPMAEIYDFRLAIVPTLASPTWIWNTRAWTLQETLMSRRLLVFNSEYVSLFCRQCVYREDLSDCLYDANGKPFYQPCTWQGTLSSPFSNSFTKSEFSMAKYAELVELYTSRNMSDPRDALAAVSGVLNIWSTSIVFASGFPHTNFNNAFIWFGVGHGRRGHPELPSWCWAAWRGAISYPVVAQEVEGTFERKGLEKFRKQKKLDSHPLFTAETMFTIKAISYQQRDGYPTKTVLEEASLIDGFVYESHVREIKVTSIIATFRLPSMGGLAYDEASAKSTDEENLIRHGEPWYGMALVHDDLYPNVLSIRSSSVRNRIYTLFLPPYLSKAEEEYVKQGECEFLMLKRWWDLHGPESQKPFRVWALLILRDRESGKATSLGCIAIPNEVWERGKWKMDTICLV